ncbi:MAG: hypothetical protein FWF70_03495 [Bacteroidetes bacterium]|nr:hypothetical protein [Bacteroidota bacterium]MCL1968596.1 hypothetical protein [Bacteroidota bacterium]
MKKKKISSKTDLATVLSLELFLNNFDYFQECYQNDSNLSSKAHISIFNSPF